MPGNTKKRINTLDQQFRDEQGNLVVQLAAEDKPQEMSEQVLKSIEKNFHRQPLQQRQDQLTKLLPNLNKEVLTTGGLTPKMADYMVENCIGIMPLPLGLGVGFKVNQKNYIVPMSVEEPSVIAACSSIAKIISTHGSGFVCYSTPPVMTGQIQFTDITDFERVKYVLTREKRRVIEYANQHCKSMVERGGGVIDLKWRQLSEDMMVVELLVNVCEAMGANAINTIAEATSPYIHNLIGQGQIGIRILTNLCTERMTMSTFEIPIEKLAWKGAKGEQVARKILEAQKFAELDQYRATTHNKGIMNGIDAVAIALGQDWRAIESSAHSYASITGKYQPLTSYKIEDGFLKAKIELPIAVGTKGGALSSNPGYINTLQIMGYPTSTEIAQVMASVGLANNFAALRAMGIQGIQRGHMDLHARNVAIQAGLSTDIVNQAAYFMKVRNRINVRTAQQYGKSLMFFEEQQSQQVQKRNLSSFFVEIFVDFLPEPLILTILLDSKTEQNYHLSIEKDPKPHPNEPANQKTINELLFGGNKEKDYKWMSSFLGLVHTIRLNPIKDEEKKKVQSQSSELIMTTYLLKLLTILTNILCKNLIKLTQVMEVPEQGIDYIRAVHNCFKDCSVKSIWSNLNKLQERIPNCQDKGTPVKQIALAFGFSLLKELAFKFLTYVDQDVQDRYLKKALLSEYTKILDSLILSTTLFTQLGSRKEKDPQLFQRFFEACAKRMNIEMMLLIDCVQMPSGSLEGSLRKYIGLIGTICEVRAVAYKDVAPDTGSISNLYKAWYFTQDGQPDGHASVAWRAKFIDFIEQYCRKKLEEYRGQENVYFDEAQFTEIMLLIENYYKLDGKLKIIQAKL